MRHYPGLIGFLYRTKFNIKPTIIQVYALLKEIYIFLRCGTLATYYNFNFARVATSKRVPLRDAIERRPPPDDALETFDEPIEDTNNQLDDEKPTLTPPASTFPSLIWQPGFSFFQTQHGGYFVQTPQRTFFSPLQLYRTTMLNSNLPARARALFYPSSPFLLGQESKYIPTSVRKI